jgi:hypothetical protein
MTNVVNWRVSGVSANHLISEPGEKPVDCEKTMEGNESCASRQQSGRLGPTNPMAS